MAEKKIFVVNHSYVSRCDWSNVPTLINNSHASEIRYLWRHQSKETGVASASLRKIKSGIAGVRFEGRVDLVVGQQND